jgi:hypothetical protein
LGLLQRSVRIGELAEGPANCRFGENKFPVLARTADQGISSKALGLLLEMAVNLAKMVKKGRVFAKFPVLFPVFRESGPHAFSTKSW